MENITEMVDRISVLPELLIHHIMSFLSFKQVIQTSILCKTWKEAWHTFPIEILEFHDLLYSSMLKRKEILKYLESILLYRHMDLISIKKVTFFVHLSYDPELKHLIDQCLCHAIGGNVKELDLRFTTRLYNMPQIVFCARSLDVLKLNGCRLYQPRICVKLFLRKLFLTRVDADDHTIQNLIAGCPLIKYLKIDACQGFKSLELFNHTKLDKIEMRSTYELKCFNIKESNVHSVTILDIPNCEINLASCKNLKCLKLSFLSVMDYWLRNGISELLLLEDLSIFSCKNLRFIKISCPCLKALSIARCRQLVEVKIETPNLGLFQYEGNIISFSSNALALSKTNLCINYGKADSDLFKYIQLLAKFHHCTEVLNLRGAWSEISIIPKELRQILHPPLSSVKRLNFVAFGKFTESSIAKLVDGLLWISPHLETASVKFLYGCWRKLSFQFTYKQKLDYEREAFHCCQYFPVSCWQNCIEKVKIKRTKFRKNSIRVKRYSFQGEKILEKIDGLYRSLAKRELMYISGYN